MSGEKYRRDAEIFERDAERILRELKNVIERAVILSPGDRLRLDLAMPEVQSNPLPELTSTLPENGFLTEAGLREYEKENMRRALEASGWRISGPNGAAERLGIKPSTLTYRMTVFGIEKVR